MGQLPERIEWKVLCIKAGLLLFIFLFVAGFFFGVNRFEHLNSLLLNGELEQAQVEIERLKRDTNLCASTDVNILHDYEKVFHTLKTAQDFKAQFKLFEESKMELEDYNRLRSASEGYFSAFGYMKEKVEHISSKELIDLLNRQLDDMNN